MAVVFLVDTSASVGSAGQQTAMAWAPQPAQSAGPRDEAGLVLFGAVPHLAVPLAHYKALPDPAQHADAATDIAAAVHLGLSLLPPTTAGRLVLLLDGHATTGDTSDGAGRCSGS